MIIDGKYIISRKETNDISVVNEGFLQVDGILNGDIAVNDNGELLIHGIVNGDIYINGCSKAIVRGIVNGKIINKSKLKVPGIIKEKILDVDGGESIIEKNSIIDDIIY
ncbi:hypothetical protein LI053_06700 [Clostridium perfringens]|uniref:hypothetical protein n=1 Tax=Clostridium perfringens TaxID=1502 RepID=UPI00224855A4|nr:hypothetical protein [Clostridium perfringens]MCX0385146.1 hypothetical protein [Clostridium perfringens]